jgi:hypothetical protein
MKIPTGSSSCFIGADDFPGTVTQALYRDFVVVGLAVFYGAAREPYANSVVSVLYL